MAIVLIIQLKIYKNIYWKKLMLIRKKRLTITMLYLFIILFSSNIFSQNSGAGETSARTIGDIFTNITYSYKGIVTFFFSISVVAGLSFSVASLLKFKQHKDNPAQVTIGQPIGLFFLGAIMLWLPFIIQSIGNTLTGAQTKNQFKNEKSIIINQKNKSESGFGQFELTD